MFGRATITLGIGPHSSSMIFLVVLIKRKTCDRQTQAHSIAYIRASIAGHRVGKN